MQLLRPTVTTPGRGTALSRKGLAVPKEGPMSAGVGEPLCAQQTERHTPPGDIRLETEYEVGREQ